MSGVFYYFLFFFRSKFCFFFITQWQHCLAQEVVHPFFQGSVYFATKMPAATTWLELFCATSPTLGRSEVKTKDKP